MGTKNVKTMEVGESEKLDEGSDDKMSDASQQKKRK